MIAFRWLLAGAWLVLATYTAIVIARYGIDLLPIFFGDIGALIWPGQFNLDFLCFLTLSALWTAWRHAFSIGGLLLGVIALFGGAGFLLPYLLVLSVRTRGNVAVMLMGPSRVPQSVG